MWGLVYSQVGQSLCVVGIQNLASLKLLKIALNNLLINLVELGSIRALSDQHRRGVLAVLADFKLVDNAHCIIGLIKDWIADFRRYSPQIRFEKIRKDELLYSFNVI